MFDNAISWTLLKLTSDLYNQHLAGRPVGDFDVTAMCAKAGTARISGTVATPGNVGVTNVDLKFDMTACHADLAFPVAGGNTTTSLRTTGTLTWKGSFSGTTTDTEYQSKGDLALQGPMVIFINGRTQLRPEIDESCAFAASVTKTLVNGTYCGRSLSY